MADPSPTSPPMPDLAERGRPTLLDSDFSPLVSKLKDDPANRRRFTLLDAMILVAASAGGLVLMRLFWVSWGPFADMGLTTEVSLANGVEWLPTAIALTTPCAAAWSATLLVLRWRPPRPARRPWQRPGILANSIIGLAILASVPVLAFIVWWSGPGPPGKLATVFLLTAPALGVAVMACWLTLLLTRRWRRAADWIDRLGLLLGVFWIIAGPVCLWVLAV